MANTGRSGKLVWVLVIILVLMFIYRLTVVPEKEEVPEQVEEIEWAEIDRIQYIGEKEIQIVRTEGQFELLQEDTTLVIEKEKIINMFSAINRVQNADKKSVNFDQWIKDRNDTTYTLLKLYKNTEEVLELYITQEDDYTLFRYPDSKDIYQDSSIKKNQFSWLDSIAQKTQLKL